MTNENIKTIGRDDFNFEFMPMEYFKKLIEQAEKEGATHIKVSYEQCEYPFIEYGKSNQS